MAPSLDIDPRFQRREWRLERIGWVLLGLFLVAALAGAAGSGWLSWATTSSSSGTLALDYERISHRQSDAFATLTVAAPRAAKVTVEISGDWVEATDLRSISPEPASQTAIPGGLRFEVALEHCISCEIGLAFRAQRPGLLAARVSALGEHVSFRQLVLP